MPTHRILVTGLPNEPGAILGGHELIQAVQLSTQAKAAGLEGKIYLIDDEGKASEFNPQTRAKGAQLAKAPWTP